MRCRTILLALLLCLVAFSGCGGGGKSGSRSAPVKFSIAWSARSRAVNAPASALSVVVTLAKANPAGGDFTYRFNREPTPDAYTGNYTSPNSAKTGAAFLAARFYAQANGTGDVVGIAQAQVIIQADGTGIGNVVTANTITSVSIPAGQTVRVSQATDLAFTARDAQGNMVAVTPGSAVFTVVSGNDKLQIVNGQAKGLALGAATVRVALDGNNSAETPVTVNPLTPLAYTVTELPPLPGDVESKAVSLNTQGLIIGVSITPTGDQRGVLWQNGSVSLLGFLAAGYTDPVQINDAGQVTGSRGSNAFLLQNGIITEIRPLQGDFVSATSLNNSGAIVSYGNTGVYMADFHAFLWQQGTLADLGAFSPYGINDSGMITGFKTEYPDSPRHAVIWNKGTLTDLGLLDGDLYSGGASINAAGHVTGYSVNATVDTYGTLLGFHWRGFLWKEGRLTDLETGIPPSTKPYTRTVPGKINDLDQIVGGQVMIQGTVEVNAFLYSEGKFLNLQTLLPANSGWQLEIANDINNNGLIVGTGLHNGNRRAFLLTPQ